MIFRIISRINIMVHLRYLLVLIFTVITFSISVNSTTDGPCTCYTAGSTCGWSMQTVFETYNYLTANIQTLQVSSRAHPLKVVSQGDRASTVLGFPKSECVDDHNRNDLVNDKLSGGITKALCCQYGDPQDNLIQKEVF
ncbi:hypothetical protein RCL_jg22826.t1 [Rhizophagus clarus]|uniref:Uncharacterized protein n=1 Tax=Rhizophagus clarus TaxID=94130 RepID=A0A8H3LFG6_9GLOM|nr:hypothetical protein RCL_jg22826.t1 [Rhizophagus clarus]